MVLVLGPGPDPDGIFPFPRARSHPGWAPYCPDIGWELLGIIISSSYCVCMYVCMYLCMRSSSHDRMISCSQLLVDLHLPKKSLSYNGWTMEKLTILQNQFPVEEVKINIMFKYKLCIYNIYNIYNTHAYCNYTKNIFFVLWKHWLPVSTRGIGCCW